MSNYLIHSAKGTEWKNTKYVKKVPNGRGGYKYIYDYETQGRDGLRKVNTGYHKVAGEYDRLQRDNMYDSNDYNYHAKRKNIEKSAEWQNIKKRQDPEYVRVNSDGKKEYLIDDYIVKKKHPGLDALDDIASGRDITLNKITKESAVAGLNDYAKLGQAWLGTRVTILNTMIKFNQGSYADDKEELRKKYKRGSAFVNSLMSAFGY